MKTFSETRLYRIISFSREFHSLLGYRFTLHWFVLGRRQPPLPYHLVIQNYNPYGRGIFWAERFVDELFTSEQAEQLEDYVNRWDGFETKVEEVELPVPIRLARPFSAIPLEKGQGWLQIYKYDDYDLPFSVAGYFDARPVIENDIPWEELSAPVIL